MDCVKALDARMAEYRQQQVAADSRRRAEWYARLEHWKYDLRQLAQHCQEVGLGEFYQSNEPLYPETIDRAYCYGSIEHDSGKMQVEIKAGYDNSQALRLSPWIKGRPYEISVRKGGSKAAREWVGATYPNAQSLHDGIVELMYRNLTESEPDDADDLGRALCRLTPRPDSLPQPILGPTCDPNY